MARFFLADDESGITLLRGPGMAGDACCALSATYRGLCCNGGAHIPPQAGAKLLLPPPVHTSKLLPTCPLPPGELDETAARGLDFVIAEAAKYGIRLTLVLLNLWKVRTALKGGGVAVGPSRHESACTAVWFGVEVLQEPRAPLVGGVSAQQLPWPLLRSPVSPSCRRSPTTACRRLRSGEGHAAGRTHVH